MAFTIPASVRFSEALDLREKALKSGTFKAGECDTAILEWRKGCNGNAPSNEEVLTAVQKGKVNAKVGVELLASVKTSVMKCKVSVKGAVSVYGINRMPVTLYAEQWNRLADYIPTVIAFIKENDGKEFSVEEYGKDGKKTGHVFKTKIKHKE
jgi:hypothetical protein